jgi:enterochelin esterase-like enzyme
VVVVAAGAVYFVVRDLIRGYWTNTRRRRDGRWGSMVLHEAIPRHGRVAIGGVSMGGYGALLLGSQRRFCAMGGHSPALWFSGADSAPGAIDDAEDYARHGIVDRDSPRRATRRRSGSTSAPPIRSMTQQSTTREIHAQLHVWPGGHDSGYWHAHLRQYLAFYAAHCA